MKEFPLAKMNCTLKVSHKTLGVQFKLCVAGGFF